MMHLAFLVLALGGLSYFLLARRTFNFYSLAYISACIYFLPGFFGYTPDVAKRILQEEIHPLEVTCAALH